MKVSWLWFEIQNSICGWVGNVEDDDDRYFKRLGEHIDWYLRGRRKVMLKPSLDSSETGENCFSLDTASTRQSELEATRSVNERNCNESEKL